METTCDYSKWFYLCLAFLGAIVIIIIISYRYNVYLDKKSIRLEANDREHERKHAYNEARIKELEKKNGSEQAQINELKRELAEVKVRQKKNHDHEQR